MIISADFFKQKKASDFFIKSGSNLVIKSSNYTLRQKINQPQSAMVIIDNETAQIKAMIGGRGASGRLLYNRAISTRQPGSSIKPLAVYTPQLSSRVWKLPSQARSRASHMHMTITVKTHQAHTAPTGLLPAS